MPIVAGETVLPWCYLFPTLRDGTYLFYDAWNNKSFHNASEAAPRCFALKGKQNPMRTSTMQVVERLYPEVLAHLQDIGDTKHLRRFGFNVTNVTSTVANPKESTGETASLAGSSGSSLAATVRSETSIPSQSQPDDSRDWQPSVPTLDFFDADLRNPSADISDICRDLVIDSWNRRNPMQLVQLQAGGGHRGARLGNQLFTAALSVAKHMFRLTVLKTYFLCFCEVWS